MELHDGGGPGFRVGHGWDLHRLEALSPSGRGRALVIGGVRLSHTHGPVAHSDGDVLYHAVTDALLGALAMEDIGQLFPDDDPRHEGGDSSAFVAEAVARVQRAGWRVSNVDATLVLEAPKISPHKREMRANLSRLLGLDIARVNVKGKTHERVDAVGEGRAVEAHAVVMLVRA